MFSVLKSCEQYLCVRMFVRSTALLWAVSVCKASTNHFSHENTISTESRSVWVVCLLPGQLSQTRAVDSLPVFHHNKKLPSTCQRLVFIKLHRLIRSSCGLWPCRQMTECASPTWPVLYDCEGKLLALPPQHSWPSCVLICHSGLDAV